MSRPHNGGNLANNQHSIIAGSEDWQLLRAYRSSSVQLCTGGPNNGYLRGIGKLGTGADRSATLSLPDGAVLELCQHKALQVEEVPVALHLHGP